MRSRVAPLIVIALLVGQSPLAASPEAHGTDNGIVVTDHVDGGEGAAPAVVGGPARPVFSYWKLAYTAQGYCRERRVTTDEALARAYDYLYARRGADANGLASLAECPANVPTVAPPNPGDLARDFWDVRHLPSPRLKIVPDYGIVGKRVYLQITGPSATAFDVPNPIGAPVAIAATSRYLVDWGDGTPPTATTSQGGPWPDGDVTHVYDTFHAAVTIRVAQQWSATWTAGPGVTGTLENLRTEGELTIRVDQLQPVRNR